VSCVYAVTLGDVLLLSEGVCLTKYWCSRQF